MVHALNPIHEPLISAAVTLVSATVISYTKTQTGRQIFSFGALSLDLAAKLRFGHGLARRIR